MKYVQGSCRALSFLITAVIIKLDPNTSLFVALCVCLGFCAAIGWNDV